MSGCHRGGLDLHRLHCLVFCCSAAMPMPLDQHLDAESLIFTAIPRVSVTLRTELDPQVLSSRQHPCARPNTCATTMRAVQLVQCSIAAQQCEMHAHTTRHSKSTARSSAASRSTQLTRSLVTSAELPPCPPLPPRVVPPALLGHMQPTHAAFPVHTVLCCVWCAGGPEGSKHCLQHMQGLPSCAPDMTHHRRTALQWHCKAAPHTHHTHINRSTAASALHIGTTTRKRSHMHTPHKPRLCCCSRHLCCYLLC